MIVAHPDDETLWAGGAMLARPRWRWTVVTACRASDPDRAPKFQRALERLGASGRMGDLDDGPEQTPLPAGAVEAAISSLVGAGPFDAVLTHGPRGEYTRHRRHEEVARAVVSLWASGRLAAGELWMFAYDDEAGRRLPEADRSADVVDELPDKAWRTKRSILVDTYGYGPDSFEVRATPRVEAFRRFELPAAAEAWVREQAEPS